MASGVQKTEVGRALVRDLGAEARGEERPGMSLDSAAGLSMLPVKRSTETVNMPLADWLGVSEDSKVMQAIEKARAGALAAAEAEAARGEG